MTKYTPNLALPYPEPTDLADGSANEYELAIQVDSLFGGPWTSWTPRVIQSLTSNPKPAVINTTTLIYCKYRRRGHLFEANMLLNITTGSGTTGQIGVEQPPSVFTAATSGNNIGSCMVLRSSGASNALGRVGSQVVTAAPYVGLAVFTISDGAPFINTALVATDRIFMTIQYEVVPV